MSIEKLTLPCRRVQPPHTETCGEGRYQKDWFLSVLVLHPPLVGLLFLLAGYCAFLGWLCLNCALIFLSRIGQHGQKALCVLLMPVASHGALKNFFFFWLSIVCPSSTHSFNTASCYLCEDNSLVLVSCNVAYFFLYLLAVCFREHIYSFSWQKVWPKKNQNQIVLVAVSLTDLFKGTLKCPISLHWEKYTIEQT